MDYAIQNRSAVAGHQNIPAVFQEILAHDERVAAEPGVIRLEDRKRRASLRADAERALRWNTDKGATAQ